MEWLIETLTLHGLQLLIGATVILGMGCTALLLTRAPIHRQRLAELCIACFCLWLLVVLVPMPRWLSWRAAVGERNPVAQALPLEMMVRPALLRLAAHSPGREGFAARPFPVVVPSLRSVRGPAKEAGPWLASLFLGGSLLMLSSLCLGLCLLAIQLGRSRPAPAWLRALRQRLLREADATMRLRVRISAGPTRPFCFGLGRGTIVLPVDLCDPSKRIQLSQVLRHEIAHLRQRDTLGQLLFAIALPALFCHPLYWWLRQKARLSAELIADD